LANTHTHTHTESRSVSWTRSEPFCTRHRSVLAEILVSTSEEESFPSPRLLRMSPANRSASMVVAFPYPKTPGATSSWPAQRGPQPLVCIISCLSRGCAGSAKHKQSPSPVTDSYPLTVDSRKWKSDSWAIGALDMRPTGAFRHQTAAQGSRIRRAVATLQALGKKNHRPTDHTGYTKNSGIFKCSSILEHHENNLPFVVGI